ncbi:MAG TPA: zinc-dependent metalloprotease [Longimicrobium sp.]|nr:zinc-dependent metalloprotease [Longimicrobium sp.]
MRSIVWLTAAVVTVVSCTPSTGRRAASPAPRAEGGPSAAAAGNPSAATPAGAPASSGATRPTGPKPYRQVITSRAVTDSGGITVHHEGDKWYLELPDSLVGRDFLMVGRIAAVPPNFGGFLPAGVSVQERLVKWERQRDRVILRAVSADAVADDSLPIARSVASNYLGAILGAFPVQAYTPDSASAVIDVTEFFGGDTPALSGLTSQQRTQWQVKRLDPARSFVSTARSYPLNVEVRHTQTFEAAAPPSDRSGGTITLEMRQSLVLLPRVPMRPRYADRRAGFFTVDRINYGLDEQKAATESFISRWRLEPKDPAAYARGELVEPVKPIVYYIDPATPARWRPYVRQGVEDWSRVFEKAGFKNAVRAMDPPTPREDPEWDPEDIRYSVVRWAASTTRNAQGPSTVDPRSGEIIESDIVWYHNHMRSYRNRLMIETGAANPSARTLQIPEALMGETMRQVITHEIGHALGLPHNMIASASFPVDSLRSVAFTRRYGVSATIMDYARQNYVAQPSDGLEPKDFIRRLGPFDDFIIEWGYRVFPDAPTPQAERARLDRMLSHPAGPMPYRYLPQYLSGIDPRNQTEDLGDDPVAATEYALANLRRVIPNLPAWTATPGEDDADLAEVYGEAVGMWSQYMRHVAAVIGGVSVDPKTSGQPGAVYAPVPRARQERALAFLATNAIRTPEWLAPASITSRTGSSPVAAAQAAVLATLLEVRRLDRLAMGERMSAAAYPLPDYLADLHRAVWAGRAPDANLRALQRVYLDRLEALVSPPPPPAGNQAAGGAGEAPPSPLLAPVNVERSDLPALARSQLRAIRADALASAAATSGVHRAHWADVAARVDAILDPGARARTAAR